MAERSSDEELSEELASVHAELRQVKAALRAREGDGHVRAILDALPDSVKIYDEDRRLVYINPCGLELHQAQDIEEMWRPGTTTVAPEYLDEAFEIHRRVIAGEAVVGTYEILGLEGKRVHVESQAVPFLLPDGRRGHMCLSRDVTDRLKAEQTLRESEERLRLVQEATALAEFEACPEGITSFTDRFLEQTGLPPGNDLRLTRRLADPRASRRPGLFSAGGRAVHSGHALGRFRVPRYSVRYGRSALDFQPHQAETGRLSRLYHRRTS